MSVVLVQDRIAKGRESERNLQCAIEEQNEAEHCCRVMNDMSVIFQRF